MIWFSCFCCASEKLQVDVHAFFAADWMDSVFAVRHSLSAPIWLKPSTMRAGCGSAAAAGGERKRRGIAMAIDETSAASGHDGVSGDELSAPVWVAAASSAGFGSYAADGITELIELRR